MTILAFQHMTREAFGVSSASCILVLFGDGYQTCRLAATALSSAFQEGVDQGILHAWKLGTLFTLGGLEVASLFSSFFFSHTTPIALAF